MADISTLEADINRLLVEGQPGGLDPDTLTKFGTEVGIALDRQLRKAGVPRERPPKTLFASEIGTFDTCPRKLWFQYHKPELAEGFTGNTKLKFIYGDIIEETVLTLAKAAGHTVEHEQREIRLDLPEGYTVVGHIDAVVDGVLVDVKSTTPFGMKDFLAGKGGEKFGYGAQLFVYDCGLTAQGVPLRGRGWIAVDKQSGHVRFIEDDALRGLRDSVIVESIESKNPMIVPGRSLLTEDNGNNKLDVECSYCGYKKECYPKMRTFKYSTGPVFYAKVVKEPKVPELI